MGEDEPRPFPVADGIDVGERRHLRYEIGETYLGDPVKVPITIIKGARPGPRLFLTAAVHGDELNGVRVVQEVATGVDPAELRGTLVCLHVANPPGYHAQTRYIPIYDQDLNRAFPGRPNGTTAERMAHRIHSRFIEPCDVGIDLHTSTRNRTTIYHVRADLGNDEVARLARAFGANVVLDGPGDEGSLRAVATAADIPTLTVEMGRAHRFQPVLIERAVQGIEGVMADLGMSDRGSVPWPEWRTVVPGDEERRWLRADVGGLVQMRWGPYPLVHEDEPICTISDHFRRRERVVRAPFTGLIVGVLENPIALPGHPLCHLVRLDRVTRDEIEREIETGEFDGYRWLGNRPMGRASTTDE